MSKLDYLHALGVDTLWLSPFYASPQADFGYDVSDYFQTAPEFGSLDECHRLIDAVHARGMKVVVLNHTSDRHHRFEESRSSRTSPRRDWYIWRDERRRSLQPALPRARSGRPGSADEAHPAG